MIQKPRAFLVALSTLFALSSSCLTAKTSDHLMGPTGLTGATGKKEIKITKVDKGSPADGKLKKGDVVIGFRGEKFSANPRKELAEAINDAEGPAQNGRLILTLKGGKSAELQLKAYGVHSKEAVEIIKADEELMRSFAGGRFAGGWKKILQSVEKNQKPTPKLISFEEAKQGAVAK